MASNCYTFNQTPSAATYRPHNRNKPTRLRRKPPTIRLGRSSQQGRGGGFVLARVFRRVKLRELKQKYYSCLFKKLKFYYHSLVKDLFEVSQISNSVEAVCDSENPGFDFPLISFSHVYGFEL